MSDQKRVDADKPTVSKKAANKQRRASSNDRGVGRQERAKRAQMSPVGTKIYDLCDDAFACIGEYLNACDVQRLLMTQRTTPRVPIFVQRVKRMIASMRWLVLPAQLGVEYKCTTKQLVAQYVNANALVIDKVTVGHWRTPQLEFMMPQSVLPRLKCIILKCELSFVSLSWMCSVAAPQMINLTRLDILSGTLCRSDVGMIARGMPLLQSLRVNGPSRWDLIKYGDYAVLKSVKSLHIIDAGAGAVIHSLPPHLETLAVPANVLLNRRAQTETGPDHTTWLALLNLLPNTLRSIRLTHFKAASDVAMERYFGDERWHGGVLRNVILGIGNEWMRHPSTGAWRSLLHDLKSGVVPDDVPFHTLRNQTKLNAYSWPTKLASLCYEYHNVVMARRILAFAPSCGLDFEFGMDNALIPIVCDATFDETTVFCHWINLARYSNSLRGVAKYKERARMVSEVLSTLSVDKSDAVKKRMDRLMAAVYISMCTPWSSRPCANKFQSLLISFGFDPHRFKERTTPRQLKYVRDRICESNMQLIPFETHYVNALLDAVLVGPFRVPAAPRARRQE